MQQSKYSDYNIGKLLNAYVKQVAYLVTLQAFGITDRESLEFETLLFIFSLQNIKLF
jgi:hypothetical protein